MPSLQQTMKWYLSYHFAGAVVRLCVSAIQVFMWLYMMSFYIEASPEIRKRRLPYIIISLIILALFSASSVMFAVRDYQLLLDIATPNEENAEAGFEIIARSEDAFWSVQSLLGDCAIRVADAVLLYRCYIVWFEHRWIVVLPACVLLGGTALNLRTYIPLDYFNGKLDAADVFLLVASNILITSLISFRLIQMQRQLRSLQITTENSVYLGIVTILVEAAAPVAVLGIGVAVSRLYSDKSYLGYQVSTIFELCFVTVAILAPQLIIFRVSTGASWADRTETTAMLSGPIAFTAAAHTKSEEEGDIEGSDR